MLTGSEWTRRQALVRAGAAVAGAAGLGVAGYAGYAATRSHPQAPLQHTPPHTPTHRPTLVQHFLSRPDLSPPAVTVAHPGRLPAADDSRFIFLTPGQKGPGQSGAMIVDTSGRLIWFSPADGASRAMDLSVQTYLGQPVLTWWEGKIVAGRGHGSGIIADTSYRRIATVRAARGLMSDLHEFALTPQGTALLTAFRERDADLSGVGGPARGRTLAGVAQEIDVATGRLLFEWDSLDHVAVAETYTKYSRKPGEQFAKGTSGQPFDYFHINSIAKAPDGDLIISARNTSAVYKVSRRDGAVRWRLGGRKSSFAMGPGARFHWQHDARPAGADGMSIFDDAAAPARERQSRGLLLALDTGAMRATVRRQYVHPGSTLLAAAMGSVQLLPSGGVFIGWGTEPVFSEFSADGRLLLDGRLPAGDESYRAFSCTWSGRPEGRPAAVVQAGAGGGAAVHASWNGATDVRTWTVLAGATPSSLARVAQAPWSGFETVIPLSRGRPYVAVEAHDASGQTLGRSETVSPR